MELKMFTFNRKVYLDNNATTPIAKPVRKKMIQVLKKHYGNPSATYSSGREAADLIDEARIQLAKSINADKDEITFNSGATEGNNHLLMQLAKQALPQKNRIIVSPIEHSSVTATLELLKKENIEVVFIPVDCWGIIDYDALSELINDKTFLICCMFANNELGIIQDIIKITAIAKSKGVPVMSDCVQALGKIPVDVKALGIDYATFSAHKLYGPKGVGAIYAKEGSYFDPFIVGGGQELGRRAGTESVHNIVGMGEACKAIPDLLSKTDEVLKKKELLKQLLTTVTPNLKFNSHDQQCTANTLSITFSGVSNTSLMAKLNMYNISVSAGSACNADGSKPSHVLSAIGLSEEQISETIRFSISPYTSEKDIRYAAKIINKAVKGGIPSIHFITPKEANKQFLFDENNYIVDIRFEVERKMMKPLPNTHEASVINFKKYIHHLPMDKNVVVVCSSGIDATGIAYTLKDKGFQSVSTLISGVMGWRVAQAKLYKELAGLNVTKLKRKD